MNAQWLQRAEKLFKQAMNLSPARQSEFLAENCGDDPEMLSYVERLIGLDEQELDNFLQATRAELTTPAQAPDPALDGREIAGYQLVRHLGFGGMGQVFLAIQPQTKRAVALKVLRPDLSSPSLARRFKLEIEVLGRLNHRGIAQIHDAGTTEDGQPWFAMEYVDGLPLTDFVKHHELTPKERLALVIQVCVAVHYANGQGVLHRDLKPANILVTTDSVGDHKAKILDFGVARLSQELAPDMSAHTLPGQLLGTLAYMSPEQAAGSSDELDARADVYQLGVLLFEMLSGQLPLETEKLPISQALRHISENEPPSLGTMDDTLRGDLEVITAKAMAKEPDRRYACAGDLGADLGRFLAGEPISARPTTTFYVLRKKLKRRRGLMLALGLVATISLALGWALFKGQTREIAVSAKLTMVTPETPTTEDYFGPAISPDGTQLAVIQRSNYNLVLKSIGGKQEKVLWPGIAGQDITAAVAWHPDGKKLLLSRQHLEKGNSLVWFDLATESSELFLETGEDYLLPVISPDGKSALVRINRYRELGVLNLETAEIVPLISCADDKQIHTPVWGPQGLRVAYIEAGHSTSYTMKCMDFNGTTNTLLMHRLLESYPTQSSMFWLPDGRLLYALDRDLSGTDVDLWAFAMDTETCQASGEAVRAFSFPTWLIRDLTYSAAAHRLAFYTRKTSREVALFDIGSEGNLTRAHLPGSGWPGRPKSFVNDGRHLVIRQTRSGDDTDVLLQDITTGELKPLMVGPEAAHAIAMSVDGKHLFHFRGDEELLHAELWAFDLEKKEDIDLGYTLDVEDYYIWISSPVNGGRSSYLFSQLGSDLITREISVHGGVGPEMVRIPISQDISPSLHVSSADMSPDAKTIAYLVNTKEVFLYDLATKKTVSVPVDLGRVQKAQWAVDGDWIYIKGIRIPDGLFWIGRVEVATGHNELLWSSETEWPNEFFMSPDGRHLSCQVVQMGAALGMLEEL